MCSTRCVPGDLWLKNVDSITFFCLIFYVSLNLIIDMCLHGCKFVAAIESLFFLGVFFFYLWPGLENSSFYNCENSMYIAFK